MCSVVCVASTKLIWICGHILGCLLFIHFFPFWTTAFFFLNFFLPLRVCFFLGRWYNFFLFYQTGIHIYLFKALCYNGVTVPLKCVSKESCQSWGLRTCWWCIDLLNVCVIITWYLIQCIFCKTPTSTGLRTWLIWLQNTKI